MNSPFLSDKALIRHMSRRYNRKKIVKSHPDEYFGPAYLTHIRTKKNAYVGVFMNCDSRYIDFVSLDVGDRPGLDIVRLSVAAEEWFENHRDTPFNIFLGLNGMVINQVIQHIPLSTVLEIVGPVTFFDLSYNKITRRRTFQTRVTGPYAITNP